MKLAVFVDQVFWFDGSAYSTDESYILFPASFTAAFDKVIFIGRLAPEQDQKPYVLEEEATELCPLPYYNSVYDIWRAGPSFYRQVRQQIRQHMGEWDVVWICGPNPVGQLIARECIKQNRPVFFIVRQNLRRQMRFMHKGIKRVAGVLVAQWMEGRFRRLARGRTVFTVGQEMANAYKSVSNQVHNHFPSLVTNAQMDTLSATTPEPDQNRLLCVGRLSAEKGYHFLLTALAELKARDVECWLDFVGSGPLEETLKAQVMELGLEDNVTFHGYVQYGPDLFAFYQKAMALVLPSLSEGLPQVICEALAAGLPVIASRVGGIPAFLTHTETGILVQPGDITLLSEAIEMVVNWPHLREKLSKSGQILMRANTQEEQRDRMVALIHSEVLSAERRPNQSALDDYPEGQIPEQPSVSAVVPVYNEIQHIHAIADTLLTQDYPQLTEIWFADGQSSDGTYEELQNISESDPRIKLIKNPLRVQSAGINLALQHIQSDIIIRLDGHAKYASDMISKSVQALMESGAGGVGAIARPMQSDTLIGQSIVAAHESKLGVGVARFRQGSASGWVDTVWNGCYWKHVVDRVGPFRVDLPRTEDNDFNARVRALGYGLYLAPDIKAYYVPRQTLRALWTQYFANGVGVIQTLFRNKKAIGWRHLVPFACVVIFLVLLFTSVFWTPALTALVFVLLLYLSALLFFSIIAWRKKPGWYILLLPLVFIILHLSYGLGALKGFFQKAIRS